LGVQTASRFEPIFVLVVPNQNNLTSGRRAAAAPRSRLRRAGLRRARPFLLPALEAMQSIGSPAWIRQDLIRALPNEDAMVRVVRRPSSPRPR
jgi:hypothetical protein